MYNTLWWCSCVQIKSRWVIFFAEPRAHHTSEHTSTHVFCNFLKNNVTFSRNNVYWCMMIKKKNCTLPLICDMFVYCFLSKTRSLYGWMTLCICTIFCNIYIYAISLCFCFSLLYSIYCVYVLFNSFCFTFIHTYNIFTYTQKT